jgi:hypothetical protein
MLDAHLTSTHVAGLAVIQYDIRGQNLKMELACLTSTHVAGFAVIQHGICAQNLKMELAHPFQIVFRNASSMVTLELPFSISPPGQVDRRLAQHLGLVADWNTNVLGQQPLVHQ